MRAPHKFATALAFAALIALPVLAQDQDDDSSLSTGTAGTAEVPVQAEGQVLGSSDLKFVQRAALDSLMEYRLGEIAMHQASSDDVRNYARSMMDSHQSMMDLLGSLGSLKNVTLPRNLDEDRQKEVDRLTKLSGRKFDEEYIEFMIKSHEDTIDRFEKEARHGKDPDLKNVAQRILPSLHDHLKIAKQTKKTIGA